MSKWLKIGVGGRWLDLWRGEKGGGYFEDIGEGEKLKGAPPDQRGKNL